MFSRLPAVTFVVETSPTNKKFRVGTTMCQNLLNDKFLRLWICVTSNKVLDCVEGTRICASLNRVDRRSSCMIDRIMVRVRRKNRICLIDPCSWWQMTGIGFGIQLNKSFENKLICRDNLTTFHQIRLAYFEKGLLALRCTYG